MGMKLSTTYFIAVSIVLATNAEYVPYKCAGEGKKSTNCGAKYGREYCCKGLVCHFQKWKCVKEENKSCAGKGMISQECGSKWRLASKYCCEGLQCSDGFCSPSEELTDDDHIYKGPNTL